MKKRVLAVLTAAMVLMMGSLTAFASESPTVGTTETPVDTQEASVSVEALESATAYAEKTTAATEGVTVEATSDTTVQAAAVQVQNELCDVASLGAALGNQSLASAAADSSKTITADVLSVVEVHADANAPKNADGSITVTFQVPDIAAGDIVFLLHYNGTAWETINPVAVADGAVAANFTSFSPVAIVKVKVDNAATAPQTGAAFPVAGVVAIIALAGATVCGRKFVTTK